MLAKMYVNPSNKLDYKTRLKIYKLKYVYRWKVSKISKTFEISRQTVYNIIKNVEEWGLNGIQDHQPGLLKELLNPIFYKKVVEIRVSKNWGACKIENYFKQKGFSVSHNKINQVIKYENLTRKKMGKRVKPSYISYEAEEVNEQWHIDWSIDPWSKKYILAIIDDKSRFIVFANLFNEATGENSAIGLQSAINSFGAPKELVSDNGTHFKNIHKGIPCEPLLKVEKKYNIKHIFIKAYHPQSNGKIERWFGSYKGEFELMNDPEIYDFITYVNYYNFERPHQSLKYKTPSKIFLKCQDNSG